MTETTTSRALNNQPAPEPGRVLIIQGHPGANSLCAALGQAYARGAQAAGARVDILRLADLSFDLNLGERYTSRELPTEPDLLDAMNRMKLASHLVFVYPTWWGTMPALLKGFIDRVFLPGYAYAYQKGRILPLGLLAGRSARLIVTMDGPGIWYRLAHGAAGNRAMRDATLKFCGIKRVGITELGQVRRLDATARAARLNQVEAMGRADARRVVASPKGSDR